MELQSTEVDKIAPAFLKAQESMKAGRRGGDNPIYQSLFMRLEDVWAACGPVLRENDIMIIQGGAIIDGKPCIATTLMHISGQFFRGYFELVPDHQGGAQGMGSAITYMRRYSLASMAGVIDSIDDDGAAAMPIPEKTTVQKIKELKGKLQSVNYNFHLKTWRKKEGIAGNRWGTELERKKLLKTLKEALKEQDLGEPLQDDTL